MAACPFGSSGFLPVNSRVGSLKSFSLFRAEAPVSPASRHWFILWAALLVAATAFFAVGRLKVGQKREPRYVVIYETTETPVPKPTPVQKPHALLDFEKRREELDRMSSEELLAVTDDWALCINVSYRLLQRLRLKPGQQLSQPERDLRLAMTLHGEVSSGGFHSFFWNSSGDRALEIHEALKRIGAPSILPLYEKALDAFPDSKPAKDQITRNDQIDALGEEGQFEYFRPLSSEYHQRSKEWSRDCAAFIRKHRDQFDVPPAPQ